MSAQKDVLHPFSTAELDSAVESLKTYAAGSSRGSLIPIDSAVMEALSNPPRREALEQQLLGILAGTLSPEAIEYICSKLAFIGSRASTASLGRLLTVERVSTAARNALEKNQSAAAAKVLRNAATRGACVDRVGAIQSLARRRDPSAVPWLRKMLDDSELEVAAAAAYALGEIGSPASGAALKSFLPRVPVQLRGAVADAAMVCAERFIQEGQVSSAKALYSAVASAPCARYVSEAAKKAIDSMSRSSAPLGRP